MMNIELDLAQINDMFATIDRTLDDATPLFNLIGQEMELAIDDRFRTESDPDGSPWAALSPKYEAYKRRKGFIQKINQRRGDLRGKIACKPYPDRLEIGSNVPYSTYVQNKRPYLYSRSGELGANAIRRIEQVADSFLQSLVQ